MDTMALQIPTPKSTAAASALEGRDKAGKPDRAPKADSARDDKALPSWFAQLIAGLQDGSTGTIDTDKLKALLQKAAKAKDGTGSDSPLAGLLPPESTADDLKDVQQFLAELMSGLPQQPQLVLPTGAAPATPTGEATAAPAGAGTAADAGIAATIAALQAALQAQATGTAQAPAPGTQTAQAAGAAGQNPPPVQAQPATAPAAGSDAAPPPAPAAPIAIPADIAADPQADAALLEALKQSGALAAVEAGSAQAAPAAKPMTAAPPAKPADPAAPPVAGDASAAPPAPAVAAAPQPAAQQAAAQQAAGVTVKIATAAVPADATAPAAPAAAADAAPAPSDGDTAAKIASGGDIAAPAPTDRPRAVEEKADAQLRGLQGQGQAGGYGAEGQAGNNAGAGGQGGSQGGQHGQSHAAAIAATTARADAAPAGVVLPFVVSDAASGTAETAAATGFDSALSSATATAAGGDSAAATATPVAATPAPTSAASAQSAAGLPGMARSYGSMVQHPPAMEQLRVQLARAASETMDKVSIRLRPDDLGSIDIQLNFAATGHVSAVVQVEKPETLELLRMDARQLERSLQDAGLQTDAGSLSFSLKDRNDSAASDGSQGGFDRGGQGTGHNHGGLGGQANSAASDMTSIAAARYARAAAAGRLDMMA